MSLTEPRCSALLYPVPAHEVYAKAYLFVTAPRNRKSVSVGLFAALVIAYHT